MHIVTRISICVVIGLLLSGIVIDSSSKVSTKLLFIMFSISSVAGAGIGVCCAFTSDQAKSRCMAGWMRNTLTIVAMYGIWRVSYFPVLVFAGTAAAYADWITWKLGVGLPAAYIIFLPAIALLHLLVTWLGVHVLSYGNRVQFSLAAFPLTIAVAISFTSADDIRFLPDRAWQQTLPADFASRSPKCNPYLPALQQRNLNPQRQALLFAAGSTYALIPQSPWSRHVQGTLEASFRDNPTGSSTDRVHEHYLAYVASHSFLASESSQDAVVLYRVFVIHCCRDRVKSREKLQVVIRSDQTISDMVRKQALDWAELFWKNR